jgi:radical SAM superfamily enzyme YgiQ (UPF0313 family)
MTGASIESYELGPIRPPNEAFSLLIRVTRNCSWNRCKFCPIYKNDKFELRTVEEIKRDIDTAAVIRDRITRAAAASGHADNIREFAAAVCNNPPDNAYRNVALWMYAGCKHAFLQDANTLIMKTPGLIEVIEYLKAVFPTIDRITSYARSKTARQRKLEELVQLREAGLSRIHMGLESGSDAVLEYMDKGVTAADHVAGGKNVVASGISLCEYVMLGVGGKKLWRQHALETARVLNEINPDFIRFRTLTVRAGMPLYDEVKNGDFIRSSDELVVEEEKLLIENLECNSNIVSDHIINLLPEVEGKLPEDKEKMLAVISRFQRLSPVDRNNYKTGRRLGIYNSLDDMNDLQLCAQVDGALARLSPDGGPVADEVLFRFMERYI